MDNHTGPVRHPPDGPFPFSPELSLNAASPQLCLQQRFFTAPCRGRRLCRPFCPVSPDYLFCRNAATVAPRASFFCCARKSRQKDALGDAIYCALTRAILFDALFGRRIAIFPKLSLPTNVLHAVTGRLHQFRFCSFPEYSANLVHALPLQTFAMERKNCAPSANA